MADALQVLGARATFVRRRESVAGETPSGSLDFAGEAAGDGPLEVVRYAQIADSLERLAALAGGEVRARIGEDRWQAHVVPGARNVAVVAAWPAGNDITKSVQRLLRRTMRRSS